MLVRC
ncbi:unnamed protein product [Linum tenue]